MRNWKIEKFNTLLAQSDSNLSERYKKYPVILQGIAQAFHLIEREGLAVRGHREDISFTNYIYFSKRNNAYPCRTLEHST